MNFDGGKLILGGSKDAWQWTKDLEKGFRYWWGDWVDETYCLVEIFLDAKYPGRGHGRDSCDINLLGQCEQSGYHDDTCGWHLSRLVL
jgi:hypothetical protein